MKRILLILTLSVSLSAFASRSYYQAIYFGVKTGSEWQMEESGVGMVFDSDDMAMLIDSPRQQFYQFTSMTHQGYDNDGDYVTRFLAKDQDGDTCAIRFIKRTDGRCEIYIDFNNVSWMYIVVQY